MEQGHETNFLIKEQTTEVYNLSCSLKGTLLYEA